MSFQPVPIEVLLYFWVKTDKFIETETSQSKEEFKEANTILLAFEEGKGNPQMLAEINGKLPEPLKDLINEYHRRNPERE